MAGITKKHWTEELSVYDQWALWQLYLQIEEKRFTVKQAVDVMMSGKVRSEESLKEEIEQIKRRMIANGRKRIQNDSASDS